jgi:hypothetical protein
MNELCGGGLVASYLKQETKSIAEKIKNALECI